MNTHGLTQLSGHGRAYRLARAKSLFPDHVVATGDASISQTSAAQIGRTVDERGSGHRNEIGEFSDEQILHGLNIARSSTSTVDYAYNESL